MLGKRWLPRVSRRGAVVLALTGGALLVVLVSALALRGTGPTFVAGDAGWGPGASTMAHPGGAGGAARPGLSVEPITPEQETRDSATRAERMPLVIGRDVVRNAQVVVEVTETAPAIRRVRAAAAAAGAVVAEEQSGLRSAWLVLRVPTAELDRFIDDISEVGTVLERTARTEDVTEQVADLEARVASRQASVARVRALLDKAESIRDVVTIESELADREAELDSLVNRLTKLRDQIAMSTLTLELRTPQAAGGSGGGPSFGDGVAAGWEGFLAVGRWAAAVLGFMLPFLPLVAVVVGGGWLLRRVVRRRRSRPVATPAAEAPTTD